MSQATASPPPAEPLPPSFTDRQFRTARLAVAESLAVANLNGEVDDDTAAARLVALAPGWSEEEDRWQRFEDLQKALQWRQKVESPGFEMASVEPEKRDEDRLIQDARAWVDDALAELVGGRQRVQKPKPTKPKDPPPIDRRSPSGLPTTNHAQAAGGAA